MMTIETKYARYARIIAAYEKVLAGKPPADADIIELLPVILGACPDVDPREIVDALRWSAAQHFREADELERRA